MSIIAASPTLTGTWVIDPVHSRIGFGAKHLGINTVRGRFDSFEGTLEVTDDFNSATVTGVIEDQIANAFAVASIATTSSRARL